MKITTVALSLLTLLVSAQANESPPLGNYAESIEVYDIDTGFTSYTVIWNKDQIPEIPQLSINRSPRDHFEADAIVQLIVIEEPIYADTNIVDSYEELQEPCHQKKETGTRHVSRFALDTSFIKKSRISIGILGRREYESASISELVDYYLKPNERGKSKITRRIVDGAGLPLFPNMNTYTLDYNREKLEILDERSLAVIIRLKNVYADALEKEFTKDELIELESFVSSDVGRRFFQLTSFKGDQGDLLEKAVDEVAATIYENIHPDRQNQSGDDNSE
ncbi:DUF2059 domain-containing protein [Coraliomargarita akajimensis]|uniref:Uncharacterized protein n=1 Tax=Coraliomargarita akajimensis (strain DSM 45221 / IAM 15411 / JCM 23193 / KCTC 12865 / 04OKA010-24) TaxID=583355 RepID=D5ER71_CORAD|nr:DUF2059 domain-containing protein [Coraliomargarita akajimensis]ADE55915.1 hypothetical protein Caka_2902 [Coraliomargarita akajimensis DSM 45221]